MRRRGGLETVGALLLALSAVFAWRAAPAADSPASRGPAPTTAGETRPADSKSATGPIRVAAILPLTGDLAVYGLSARQGMELAVAQVNRNGGVAGRQIQLLLIDTQSKPPTTEPLATRAVAVDKVEAIIGGLDGPTALAVRPVAEKWRVPFLVLCGSYRFPPDGSQYTRRVCASDVELAEGMAQFARRSLEFRRPFLVADVSADQRILLADRFAEKSVSLGAQLAGIGTLAGTRDLGDLAAKVAAAQPAPDAIFAALHAEQLIALAAKLREKKIALPLLACAQYWSVPPLLAGEAAAVRSMYLAVPFAADDPDPRVRQFLADYAEACPKTAPDAMAVQGYDALLLLAEAARQRPRNGGELRDRLLQLRNVPTVVGPSGFGDDAGFVRPVVICQVTDSGAPGGGNRLKFIERLVPAKDRPASQPAERSK